MDDRFRIRAHEWAVEVLLSLRRPFDNDVDDIGGSFSNWEEEEFAAMIPFCFMEVGDVCCEGDSSSKASGIVTIEGARAGSTVSVDAVGMRRRATGEVCI